MANMLEVAPKIPLPRDVGVVEAVLPPGMKPYRRINFDTLLAATIEMLPVEVAADEPDIEGSEPANENDELDTGADEQDAAANPDIRLTIGSLVTPLMPDQMANPQTIEEALRIPYYYSRISVLPDPEQTYAEVVFPAHEFGLIARSPADLAVHTENRVRATKKKATDPNREAVNRSVVEHTIKVLDGKLTGLTNYIADAGSTRLRLQSLVKDINQPRWQAHYRARDLAGWRHWADSLIHEAGETSTINTPAESLAVSAMHRVIHDRLYGGDDRRDDQDERLRNWSRYIHMVGRYNNRKAEAADLARMLTAKEIGKQYERLKGLRAA